MTVALQAASAPLWHRILGALAGSRLALGWLWLGVVIVWLVVAAITHGLAELAIGPAQLPFATSRFVWTMIANGSLLGVLIAGHIALQRGVATDLRALAPALSLAPEALGELEIEIARAPRLWRAGALALGVAGGLAMATLDPALRGLHPDLSAYDPRYLLFVGQNMLFAAMSVRLFVTEVHMTRAYARLGEKIEVDLLDPSAALVFGRKGLRSVAVWVLQSSAISMFWVLDSAAASNVLFTVVVLGLATTALVAPTLGVRRNVMRAKARELEAVTRAIRRERDALFTPGSVEGRSPEGRLSDLIQYEGLVRRVREWPFDLSIVSRSLLFVLLGCGSWLGGAVAERLLGLLLD